jgi:hypothetical protein
MIVDIEELTRPTNARNPMACSQTTSVSQYTAEPVSEWRWTRTNSLVLYKIQILRNSYWVSVQSSSCVDNAELDTEIFGRAFDADSLGPWENSSASWAGEVSQVDRRELSLHTSINGVGRAHGLNTDIVEADAGHISEGS